MTSINIFFGSDPCLPSVVVASLGEYARRARSRVSGNTLEGDCRSVQYTMVITQRKKKKKKDGLLPHEKYIGFATNVPTQDTCEYAARWGIETAYRLVEEMSPKTRVAHVAARMLCFYYSLLAYNEWMILRIMLSDGRDSQSAMTQLTFKHMVELDIPEPKPPT